ncbi:MAG: hypothetical protein QXT13_09690 [Pyrobaculum sp.]
MIRIILLILLLTIVATANELWIPFVLPAYPYNCAQDLFIDRQTHQTTYVVTVQPGTVINLAGGLTLDTLQPGQQNAWTIDNTVQTGSSVSHRISSYARFFAVISYIADVTTSSATLRTQLSVSNVNPANTFLTVHVYTVVMNRTWAFVHVARVSQLVGTGTTITIDAQIGRLSGRYVVIQFIKYYAEFSATVTFQPPTILNTQSFVRYATPAITAIRPTRNQFCHSVLSGNVGFVFHFTCSDTCTVFNMLNNATQIFRVENGRYIIFTTQLFDTNTIVIAHISGSIYVNTFINNTSIPPPPRNNAIYDGATACTHTLRDVTLVDGTRLDTDYYACAQRVPIWARIISSSTPNTVVSQPAWLTTQLPGTGVLVCRVVSTRPLYTIMQDNVTTLQIDPWLWPSGVCGRWVSDPQPFPRHLYLVLSGINITIVNRPHLTQITLHRSGGIINRYNPASAPVTGFVIPRDTLLFQMGSIVLPIQPLVVFNRTIVNFRQLLHSGTLTINVYTPYAQFALVPYYIIVWQNGTVVATGVLQSATGPVTLYGALTNTISEYAICNMAGMCALGTAFLQNNAILVLAQVGTYGVGNATAVVSAANATNTVVRIGQAGRAPVVNVTAYYTPPDSPLMPLVAPLTPPAPVINNPIPVEAMALILLPLVAFVGSVTLGRDLIESMIVGALAFVVVSMLFGNTQFIALAIATLVMTTVWMMVRR